jgi:hypothetical protein
VGSLLFVPKKNRRAQLRPCLYIIGVSPEREKKNKELNFFGRPKVDLIINNDNEILFRLFLENCRELILSSEN